MLPESNNGFFQTSQVQHVIPGFDFDLPTILKNDSDRKSSSVATLLSTLIPVFVVAVLSVVGFLFLRRTERHVYAPRTYLDTLDDDEKTPPSRKHGWFNWIPNFYRLKDADLLQKQSLDAYLFLRFFKMMILICLVGVCLTWPILLPVNLTGRGKEKQLDRLTISNIKDPNRYYAHVFVAWAFLGFVMFTVTRETLYYVNLRQAYMTTPWNASRISSRTVLFTSVPKRCLDEDTLKQMFDSVKRVWINTECSKVDKLVHKRDSVAKQLESAQVDLSVHAVKTDIDSKTRKVTSTAAHMVGASDRPTHRTTLLVGKKVDTVDWSREQLPEALKEASNAQEAFKPGEGKPTGAVFIEFETVPAAQAAFQMTSFQAALVMTPRCISAIPSSIIWENMHISAWQLVIRGIIATTFIAVLIIFWSVPVAFVGTLSNIDYLTEKVPFLKFIDNLPASIRGALKGLVPSLALSYIVSLVPMICRYVAYQAGEITTANIELKTQEWYFMFQIIQVFLVTTFSSGATAVVSDIIDDPKSAPELLAKALPDASTFYISYFIVYGFGQSTKNLLNISSYLMDKFFGFFDKTPREKYDRYTKLSGTGWGSWYPKFTNLAVIAISYSCIAPLTLGFATIGLGFLYLVFRYNFFYVLRTSIDTGGQAYARALQQITAGVYLSEICLIGQFSLSIKDHGSSSGPFVLMILFTIATILYHRAMHKALSPLTKTLASSVIHQPTLTNGDEEESPLINQSNSTPPPPGVAGLFLKFFEPQRYASYEINQRQLSATRLGDSVPPLPEDKERTVYLHPSLTSKPPKLWIARDEKGVSKKEIRDTEKEIEITDEGAWVDERGKVMWDKDNLKSLPVWKDRVYY